MTARLVFIANGPFSVPKLPGIAGIQDFKAKVFHTSRWDYGYSGGDILTLRGTTGSKSMAGGGLSLS